MKVPVVLGIVMLATVGVIGLYIVKTLLTGPTALPTDNPDITAEQAGGITRMPVSPSPMRIIEIHKDTTSIDEQAVVIYRPDELAENTPTTLIIYSHGSNEHIDPALISSQFAQDLDRYGEYFATQGALFLASEMYGENWGSRMSRDHLLRVIEYASSHYDIEPTVVLYGFSMGGLPTLRFAKDYPAQVDLILLLAPTIAIDDWDAQAVSALNAIPIRIWHGTRDVNVPHSLSDAFMERVEGLGHTNTILMSVPDETHRHFVEPARLWQEIESLLIR